MKKLVTIFALFTLVMLTSFVEPTDVGGGGKADQVLKMEVGGGGKADQVLKMEVGGGGKADQVIK